MKAPQPLPHFSAAKVKRLETKLKKRYAAMTYAEGRHSSVEADPGWTIPSWLQPRGGLQRFAMFERASERAVRRYERLARKLYGSSWTRSL